MIYFVGHTELIQTFNDNVFSGIIDVEDPPEDDPEDEILAEIKQKQQDLRALHERNIVVIKQLIRKAKEEMSRQEMRKKLVAADTEVFHGCVLAQLLLQDT